MSTPQLDHDTLQRYFDGELPEEEATRVEQALAESEEAKAHLSQLGQLRDFVRMAAEDIPEVASEELFGKVREGIDKQEAEGFGKGFRVVPGSGGAGRRRTMVAVGGVLALAAAAVIALMQPWAADEGSVARRGQPKPPKAMYAEARGSEVIEVDFGNNTGTVFEIEGESGQSIAVVWIDEEGAP